MENLQSFLGSSTMILASLMVLIAVPSQVIKNYKEKKMWIFFPDGNSSFTGLHLKIRIFSINKKLFYIYSGYNRFNFFHNHSLAIYKIQKTKLIILGFFNNLIKKDNLLYKKTRNYLVSGRKIHCFKLIDIFFLA